MKISARSMYQGQSHYTYVAQGAIFIRLGSVGNTEKNGGPKKNQTKFKKKIAHKNMKKPALKVADNRPPSSN